MKRNNKLIKCSTINLFCCVTLHTHVCSAEMTYTRALSATANKHQTTEKLCTQNPAKNASHELILIHLFNSSFFYFSLLPSITARYIGRRCEYSVWVYENKTKQQQQQKLSILYASFSLFSVWLAIHVASFEFRQNWFGLDSVSHHHIITLSFIVVCLSFKDYAYWTEETECLV